MKKVISSLINSNLACRTQQRTQLFFGQYALCLRAYQTEFHCLRGLDHDRIDRVIRARQEWGRRVAHQPGSWHWTPLAITDQDRLNLHAMCDWLQTDTRERKMTIAGSWFYVYTNDRALLQDLAKLPWLDLDRMGLTEVELVGQPGSVHLRQARYQQRTYLRSMILDARLRENLTSLLLNQEDIRISPGLSQWIRHPRWNRTFDYHFIDHDGDAILTMLGLLSPRLIRRTLPIVADK